MGLYLLPGFPQAGLADGAADVSFLLCREAFELDANQLPRAPAASFNGLDRRKFKKKGKNKGFSSLSKHCLMYSAPVFCLVPVYQASPAVSPQISRKCRISPSAKDSFCKCFCSLTSLIRETVNAPAQLSGNTII